MALKERQIIYEMISNGEYQEALNFCEKEIASLEKHLKNEMPDRVRAFIFEELLYTLERKKHIEIFLEKIG